ncbi:MAG: thioredoxin [Desulfosalsimonas sp.]
MYGGNRKQQKVQEGRKMAEAIKEISDNTFEQEVLKADQPVLVDFWAPWCGPCKAIAPVLEEISKDYEGKIKIVKCNVDDNPSTPSNYGIRAIPTLILFKNGEKMEQIVGMVQKAKLEDAINKSL